MNELAKIGFFVYFCIKMVTFSIKYLESVDSTNAALLEMPEKDRVGMVFSAHEQRAGKGMGSNGWESHPGMNLTFSMGVDMSFMKAADQFLLSMAVPLGLVDVLDSMFGKGESASTGKLKVKWPNDLVYEGRKLCGILINSTIHGDMMGVSVVGIGLNVNQIRFQDWPTHPISLKMILEEDVTLEPLLEQLVVAVDQRVQRLRSNDGIAEIKKDYFERMYRYRQWGDYETKEGKVKRFITGLDPFGRLETIDETGKKFVYDIKEIKLLTSNF